MALTHDRGTGTTAAHLGGISRPHQSSSGTRITKTLATTSFAQTTLEAARGQLTLFLPQTTQQHHKPKALTMEGASALRQHSTIFMFLLYGGRNGHLMEKFSNNGDTTHFYQSDPFPI